MTQPYSHAEIGYSEDAQVHLCFQAEQSRGSKSKQVLEDAATPMASMLQDGWGIPPPERPRRKKAASWVVEERPFFTHVFLPHLTRSCPSNCFFLFQKHNNEQLFVDVV
jgi:hypothetical protein